MNTKAKPSTYFYKLFRVTLADGRVTTVSLAPKLLARAETPMGGVRALNAWVRQTALSYTPDQGSRLSGFVAQCLQAELDMISPVACDKQAPRASQVPTKSKPAKLTVRGPPPACPDE